MSSEFIRVQQVLTKKTIKSGLKTIAISLIVKHNPSRDLVCFALIIVSGLTQSKFQILYQTGVFI